MSSSRKERLDVLVTQLHLAESREKAQALIMSGAVTVDGVVREKAGQKYPVDATVKIVGPDMRYVSRGGLKLEAAIKQFGLNLDGMIALDIGASTGGFTDCLLQHGTRKVYAVDVGYGQIHTRLRSDPRVVVIERTNARYLSREQVPESPSIVTMDVSFISVTKVLPAVIRLCHPGTLFVLLIKPQFEAGREHVRQGVVREQCVHRQVLRDVITWCNANGLSVNDATHSPLRGPEGNIEFWLHAEVPKAKPMMRLTDDSVALIVERAHQYST